MVDLLLQDDATTLVESGKALGVAIVTAKPKTSSARMIVNMSQSANKATPSINKQLSDVYTILQHEVSGMITLYKLIIIIHVQVSLINKVIENMEIL